MFSVVYRSSNRIRTPINLPDNRGSQSIKLNAKNTISYLVYYTVLHISDLCSSTEVCTLLSDYFIYNIYYI